MTLPNICLIGGTGAGKTTAAKLLEDYFGYHRLGFAGADGSPHPGSPRDIVTRIWGPEAAKNREKLIGIANEARRLDPDVWLNALKRELVQDVDAPGFGEAHFVVDDCRFENEFYGLKGAGFVTARVVAPLAVRINRLKANGKWLNDEYLDHPIEHYLDAADAEWTILGDCPTDELYNQLVKMINVESRR